MQSKNSQATYFLQYLSSAPVLAVLTVSALAALWMFINYFVPDILFFTKP
jgi:photosystem I subunit 9